MKTFEKMAAQGDMLIRKIDALPAPMEQMEPMPSVIAQHFELAHSETGHSHVVLERPGVQHVRYVERHAKGMDILRSFLIVPDDGEVTDVVHLRSTHTHETLRLPGPGIYEITRQREHDVTKGWRYAAD